MVALDRDSDEPSRGALVARYRKLVTTGVGFCFLVVGCTGVCFKLSVKSHPLEEIHGWLGLAMVGAAGLHIVNNWRSLRKHLGDPRVYALLVPIAIVCAVFVFDKAPPQRGLNPRRILSQLVDAHASDVARVFGRDVNAIYAAMQLDGIKASDPGSTLSQLAESNQVPPERVLGYFAN